MIPERFEYFFILTVFALVLFGLFQAEIAQAIKRKATWLTFAIFFLFCAVFDVIAIQQEWWLFNEERISAIRVATVPIEEYLLFVLAFIMIIGTWECIGGDQ